MLTSTARLGAIALALGLTSNSSGPITDEDLSKAVAAVIVNNGFLCASVLDISPLSSEDVFEVTCTERPDVVEIARYIMNMKDGTARPA